MSVEITPDQVELDKINLRSRPIWLKSSHAGRDLVEFGQTSAKNELNVFDPKQMWPSSVEIGPYLDELRPEYGQMFRPSSVQTRTESAHVLAAPAKPDILTPCWENTRSFGPTARLSARPPARPTGPPPDRPPERTTTRPTVRPTVRPADRACTTNMWRSAVPHWIWADLVEAARNRSTSVRNSTIPTKLGLQQSKSGASSA